MRTGHFNYSNRNVTTLVVAALMPWLFFILQGKMGLSLWDEGFLWYGAQRVLIGEIPLLDFQSYDIGRYYWAAGVMSLIGNNGILALRLSNAALLSVTMLIAVYLIIWKSRQLKVLESLLILFTFMLWMTPDYKVADFLAPVALVFVLAYVIDRPCARRYFICGIIVGIAAILGRNHGVYGVAGSIGATAYLVWQRTETRLGTAPLAWVAGVVVGYMPMLLFLMMVHGFAGAFADSIQALFEYGSTNLARPWPRPWWVRFEDSDLITESLGDVLTGVFFIALPCFATICTGYLVIKRWSKNIVLNPVFVSATLLMWPYAHYAFSRADVAHLAFGIFPFLIGLLTFRLGIGPHVRYAVTAMLFAASLLVMLPQQPGYKVIRAGDTRMVTVVGDKVNVTPEVAMQIAFLTELSDRFAPHGRSFFTAPFWPGAYAILERKSPTWEIYELFPKSESFQKAEIARLQAADVGFVVLTDIVLDGRRDLFYQATHPTMERYIRETFRALPGVGAALKARVFIADPVSGTRRLSD